MDKSEKEITISSLEYQYHINYLNVTLMTVASFLLALWLTNIPFTILQKIYWTLDTFGAGAVLMAHLHDKLNKQKTKIRLMH